MKKTLLTFIIGLLCAGVSAQNMISQRDANQISFLARQKIQDLPRVFNMVTNTSAKGNEVEIAEICETSYTLPQNGIPAPKQYFLNKSIIVENDLDPVAQRGSAEEMNVEDYLKRMDVQYEKGDSSSIIFSDIQVSNVKMNKEFMYALVKFNSNFKGKYTATQSMYKPRQREAIIWIKKIGKDWAALISSIKFALPDSLRDSKENDLQIVKDTASKEQVNQDDFNRARDSLFQAKDEENRKIEAAFNSYVALGDNYMVENNDDDALAEYQKASDLKPMEVSLDIKIHKAEKLHNANTYDNLKSLGNKAKDERRYKLAVQYYQAAIVKKPDASVALGAEIRAMTEHITIMARPQSKIESKQAQEAIDECEKLLHDLRDKKSDYAELYYLEGLAYELKLEANPGDNRLKDKAVKSYEQAIKYFKNYLDAYIAHANFSAKYMSDYVSAIADYDVLTLNALNNAPEKPSYFVTKARWKTLMKNNTGAIQDYNNAIELAPKVDSLYLFRGICYYDQGKAAAAKTDFDMAIKLNQKYANAYYYRGLALNSLHKTLLAGKDFASLENLGVTVAQGKTVQNISSQYFATADSLRVLKDYKMADSIFSDALNIRPCNDRALHGKAEIYFALSENLGGKAKNDAQVQYQRSIDFNRQAIKCNPDFSNAHYQEGQAHSRIGEHNLALESYKEAIRSYPQNTRAMLAMGKVYQLLEKHPNAVDTYNQAISILSANYEMTKKGNDKVMIELVKDSLADVNQLCGKSLFFKEDYSNALLCLKKSINLKDANPEAYYYSGLVYQAQNNFSDAIKNYKAAIKLANNYNYHYACGMASIKDKNYSQAIDNFSNTVTYDTLNVIKDKYNQRGISYFKTKKYDLALTDFAEYAKYDDAKSDSDFYTFYGYTQLYADKNNVAPAVNLFKQSLQIGPADGRAFFGLGCAAALSGSLPEALEWIQKAFETKKMTKEDVRAFESAFLGKIKDNKESRKMYEEYKNKYNPN